MRQPDNKNHFSSTKVDPLCQILQTLRSRENYVIGYEEEDLHRIESCDKHIPYVFVSSCKDECARTAHLDSVISSHETLNEGSLGNCFISLATSPECPLRTEEMVLIEKIAAMCNGETLFVVAMDPSLDKELELMAVFYE